jgi:hypothetical protein
MMRTSAVVLPHPAGVRYSLVLPLSAISDSSGPGLMEGAPLRHAGEGAGGEFLEHGADPGRLRLPDGQVVLVLDEEQPGKLAPVLLGCRALRGERVGRAGEPLPEQRHYLTRRECAQDRQARFEPGLLAFGGGDQLACPVE